MSNFQSINDEEIEQDSLVADVNTINSNIVVINNKINLTAGSNMKSALDLNSAKTSFPGFGTSEGTALKVILQQYHQHKQQPLILIVKKHLFQVLEHQAEQH